MRKLIKITCFFVISALSCRYAYANGECSAQPSCSELGYETSISANCPSDNILLCPFDLNYKKCIIPSCSALGFTTDDKSSWCEKVVLCPRDESYSLCAKSIENPCPVGYDSKFKSVSDCGVQGSNGWTFTSQNVSSVNGTTVTCGKCLPKSCSGNAAKKSVSDCGSSGSQGWLYSSCYYGDELRGTCTKKTCVRSCPQVWKEVTQYSGDTLMTCYKCANCISQGGISACAKEMGCRWACQTTPTRPSGYDKGSCPTGYTSWICCSYTQNKPNVPAGVQQPFKCS